MSKHPEIMDIYQNLLGEYGPQGWWPVTEMESRYHPDDFSVPYNDEQRFEICVGAVLTQNTSWRQVEKAIENLKVKIKFTPEAVESLDTAELSELIRPSGYFNQKAKKIKLLADFLKNKKNTTPNRNELLEIWGIGPETADSILLYAYSEPIFVIDAYTRRIFENLGIATIGMPYDELRFVFEKNIPKDIKIYQEYHALIVMHAKNHYSKKPWARNCQLKRKLKNASR